MLDLTSLKKSINVLDNLIIEISGNIFKTLDNVLQDGLKAGVIQNFEVSYELAWKFMKRYLEENLGNIYVDGVSRKELFRLACETGLIADVEQWFIYHRARNETSHTYDGVTAEEVFIIAQNFIHDVKSFLTNLELKND